MAAADKIASTIPPPVVYARGFDVSKYSGVVDFDAFKADGFDFCIVRSSVGLSEDSRYEDNARLAHAAGLIVGTYHGFFDTLDPEKQAELYASLVKKMGFPMMEPCNDFELLHGLTGQAGLDRALAFQVACEQAWKIDPEQSALYTYPSFWDALPSGSVKQEFARRQLFIAHYGVENPRVPAPWTSWTVWQHKGDILHDSIVDLDCYRGPKESIPLYTPQGT